MVLAEKMTTIKVEYDTVKHKNTLRKKKYPIEMMVLAIVLLGLIVGNLIIQALVIEKNLQIKTWNEKIQEKEREILKLRMEIADLESFERIQNIAQNELGMRNAGPKDLLVIKAAPEYKNNLPAMEYLAKVRNHEGLWSRFSHWVGGIGKTMAKEE